MRPKAMLLITISFGLITALLILYWKAGQSNSHLSKITRLPAPWYPIFGHALSLPHIFENFFTEFVPLYQQLAKSKKKLCYMRMGTRTAVWLIHPETAQVILKSKKHIGKGPMYNFLRPFINDGLLTSSGSKWQKRRKMITPSFHSDILKDFLHIMNEHAAGFVDCIEQDLLNGRQVDIKQRLKLCTLDIICESALGCKVHAQDVEDNEYVEAEEKIGTFFLSRRLNPLLVYDFIFNRTRAGREQTNAIKILHEFSRNIIHKKMSESLGSSASLPPKRKAFLDMLMTAQTEDGSSLSADDIQEEVDTFMGAGHDTTAVAATWGVYTLGRYPEKQKKLQEELDSVFAGDKTCDVTFDHIKDLTYLDLVVKEMLRLYPSVPFIGRILEEDCELDGVTIPKGQLISIFVYFINRHPDIWEEPNKFIPERFETENRLKNTKSPYSYIPFSAGPRNCIGQRFAIQELKIIFAKFFRRFSVVSLDVEEEIKVEVGLVLKVDQKLNIKVTRNSAM